MSKTEFDVQDMAQFRLKWTLFRHAISLNPSIFANNLENYGEIADNFNSSWKSKYSWHLLKPYLFRPVPLKHYSWS